MSGGGGSEDSGNGCQSYVTEVIRKLRGNQSEDAVNTQRIGWAMDGHKHMAH